MNLQEIRARYESRVAAIEHEMFELLGKLNMVNEVLNIAAQLDGDTPVTTGRIEERTEQPAAVMPKKAVELPEAANEDKVAAGPSVVAMPQAQAAATAPVQAAEAEVAEQAADEDEPVAEIPQVEVAEQAADEDEPVAEAPVVETPQAEVASPSPQQVAESAPAADIEEVVADVKQDVPAESEQQPVQEPAAVAVDADADNDAIEKTDQFEQLFDPATSETEAEAGTDQFEQLFDSVESEADLEEASDDALSSLREKLASAANEDQPKSPFMSLGKFLNRAK
jgi:hypothetical protein